MSLFSYLTKVWDKNIDKPYQSLNTIVRLGVSKIVLNEKAGPFKGVLRLNLSMLHLYDRKSKNRNLGQTIRCQLQPQSFKPRC